MSLHEMVLLERFPVNVHWPDGTRDERRKVVITTERLVVFHVGAGNAIIEEHAIRHTGAQVADQWAAASTPHLIETESGQVQVVRGGGCACGSPLAGHRWVAPEEIPA